MWCNRSTANRHHTEQVAKVIWKKAESPIAAAHLYQSRFTFHVLARPMWRQMHSSAVGAGHANNATEPTADECKKLSEGTHQRASICPPQSGPSRGWSGPIYCKVPWPTRLCSQTASWSVQPFLHSLYNTQTHGPRYVRHLQQ